MIRLSGLEPERDIAIEVVGARPGEKLHEELFNPYERPQPTPAEKIVRADRAHLDPAWVEQTFGEINLFVLEGDAAALAAKVAELPPAPVPDAATPPSTSSLVDCPTPPMSLTFFAFSVHTFIDKIGAYAGFAAIIGLAVFALLLFSQARELHRLREWGAQAHDRMGELEQRLAAALELARRAGASQRTAASGPAAQAVRGGRPLPQRPGAPAAPARVTPVPASTSGPVRLPLLPAAPVGVAGPALASATPFIALPDTPPGVAAPAVAPAAPAPALPSAGELPAQPAPPAPVAPAVTPAAQTVAAPAPVETTDFPAPTPQPGDTTVAEPLVPEPTVESPAGSNGTGELPPAALPPRRPAAPARPAAARPGARPPARPPARPVRSASGRPAAPLRASTPSASPRGATATPTHHARRRVAAVLAVGAALVVAVVAVIALTSGGGSKSAATNPSTQSAQTGSASGGHTKASHTTKSSGKALPPAKTTVAVLNGTGTPGLANTVANTLAGDGYQRGPVGNASDHQRSVTIVAYTGGHQPEATEVAKSLGVPSDAVQAIDAGTQASACGGTAACSLMVVVTVGADRQH